MRSGGQPDSNINRSPRDQALRKPGLTPGDRTVIREERGHRINRGTRPGGFGSDGARVGSRRSHGKEYTARNEAEWSGRRAKRVRKDPNSIGGARNNAE